MSDLFDDCARAAAISACGQYRYTLVRQWDTALPWLGWIMLNPSTADADQDDPTIRVCCKRARQMRFGGIMVVNLFALRATDPKVMKRHGAPVGPDNNEHITSALPICGQTICAWGRHGDHLNRDVEVTELALRHARNGELWALKITGNQQPYHPLMLGYDVEPFVWKRA